MPEKMIDLPLITRLMYETAPNTRMSGAVPERNTGAKR